jgi:hypothetical protein
MRDTGHREKWLARHFDFYQNGSQLSFVVSDKYCLLVTKHTTMSHSGPSQKRVVYTLEEQVILREIVKNYISVVENKSTNKVGLKKKDEAWDQITLEFNQQPNVSARDSKS